MPEIRPLLQVFFILLSALNILQTGSALAQSGPVGCFVSSKIRPYLEALDGFKGKMDREIQVLYLDENLELARHYLKKGGLEAAVAIGPEAVKLIYSPGVNVPVKMAIMTLDIKKLVPGSSPCGIDLRVPISFQVSEIGKSLGSGKDLAILYNPAENSTVIRQAAKACMETGLEFTPLPVSGPDEIMKLLKPEMDRIDILLFIPDSTVISEKVVRHLTKEALMKGTAVAGYNHFFYETGALLSFTIDYRKVGMEGARLLQEFSREQRCSLVPPPVEIEWNKKVLEILRERDPARWSKIPGGPNNAI